MTSEMHNWVVEVNEKLSNMESIPRIEAEDVPPGRSIYRVDETIREKFGELDCSPRIVSFGPYYNGHRSCEPTEKVKENVLLHFLKKCNRRLYDYIEILKEDVQYLKDHYSVLDPKWPRDDDAFLRLMILDGCFLLEAARETCKSLEADISIRDYKSDNLVWGIEWYDIPRLREWYKRDMLLLENQIPMKVLYTLCGIEINNFREARDQVHYDILRLLHNPLPLARTESSGLGTYHHVLDLYRDNLLFRGHTRWVRIKSIISYFLSDYFKTASATGFRFNMPSITELEKAGIGITASKTMGLMDASFRGITLRLPLIFVDSATKLRYLQIIAFEQAHVTAKKEVTSYINFMSRLLRCVDDVRILESRDIIRSELRLDEIVEAFNNLATWDIMHDPDFFLVSEYKSLGANLRKGYNMMFIDWKRDLWQTYLKSPYAIISVIAAFFLFVFPAIQTIYAVLSYCNH